MEHSEEKRRGGLDACCEKLACHLSKEGIEVKRRAVDLPKTETKSAQMLHRHGMWNTQFLSIEYFPRLPRVYSPHGMLEPWSLTQKKWIKRLAWWGWEYRLLNSSALLHATSQAEASHLRRLGIRSPIAVVPLGTDVPNIENLREARNSLAPKEAVFLSRIHPKKGLNFLVQAWAQIKPSGWKLRIIGPDEANHQQEIQTQIESLGIQSSVSMEKPQAGEQKWRTLCNADLMVLPTHSENFGLIVAEAMACGVPAITTVGTPWSDLQTNRCGWWIPIGTEPLIAALKDAISISDDERREMGNRGRDLVERKYTWGKVAERMALSYKWVLESSSSKRVIDCPSWFFAS